MHYETYRMLGHEHDANLEREAAKWSLAAQVRRHGRAAAAASNTGRRRSWWRSPVAYWVSFIAPTREANVK